MAAHHHGQILNASELGRSLGEAHTTIRRHLELLCGSYVMRLLPPWFENLAKRQVRSPKLYVRDSGLLHTLLGIDSAAALQSHPKLGASWEGLALEQILSVTGDRDAYFWGSQAGAELDLLIMRDGRRFGVECKYADAPALTKSMHIARAELQLDRLWVVHPGDEEYPLQEWAAATGLPRLLDLLRQPRWT
jgi:predicted AAA+ superfamily ATPase